MTTEEAYTALENLSTSVEIFHKAEDHLISLLGTHKYIKAKQYFRPVEAEFDIEFDAACAEQYGVPRVYDDTSIPNVNPNRTVVERVREFLEIRGSAGSKKVAIWLMITPKHASSLMSSRPEFVFNRGTGKWSLKHGTVDV